MKKAQISLFMIIGIVLLIFFSLVIFILIKSFVIDSKEVQFKSFDDVENAIASCLSSSARDQIKLLLLQGGYLNPDKIVDIKGVNITILQKSQTREGFEKDLTSAAKPKFLECITELETHLKGITIKYSDPIFHVSLNPENIITTLKFPLVAYNKNKRIDFSDFEYSEDLKISDLLSIVDQNMKFMINNEHKINQTFLSLSNIEAEIFKYETGIIFDMRYNKSKIYGEPLEIIYAIEK